MSAATVVMLGLKASLACLVFGTGLHTSADDATFLVRHPGLLARSVLAMNVFVPLLALWMAVVLGLNPAVEVALIAFAVSPMPPFLPLKTAKLGGEMTYTISLLATESLLSIVFIPVTIWALGALFGRSLNVPASLVTRIVVPSVIAPLAIGVLIRRLWPTVALRLVKPVNVIAMVLLVVGGIPLVIRTWRPMISLIGNGTIVAIVALVLAGLAIGHVLGGPVLERRPVLALSSATRHPAVAIAIVTAVVPRQTLAPAAVLLALIAAGVASLPYSSWIKQEISTDVEQPLVNSSGIHVMPRRSVTNRRSPHPPSHRPSAAVPSRRRGDRRA